MKDKFIVLPKRNFNFKLKLNQTTIVKKTFEFFWALALEKTQIRHGLPTRLSRILCSSLLFINDLFSVCFQERLGISFSRYSSLDICLFTYVFLVLFRVPFTVLVSSLTFLRVFLDSLYVFYFLSFFRSLSLFLLILFSLKTLSPQT